MFSQSITSKNISETYESFLEYFCKESKNTNSESIFQGQVFEKYVFKEYYRKPVYFFPKTFVGFLKYFCTERYGFLEIYFYGLKITFQEYFNKNKCIFFRNILMINVLLKAH